VLDSNVDHDVGQQLRGIGRRDAALLVISVEDPHGLVGIGEHEHRERTTLVSAALDAEELERVGQMIDGRIQASDDREVGADVKPPHAVLGGSRGPGERLLARPALPLRGCLGV
jgi:hypothetical protein